MTIPTLPNRLTELFIRSGIDFENDVRSQYTFGDETRLLLGDPGTPEFSVTAFEVLGRIEVSPILGVLLPSSFSNSDSTTVDEEGGAPRTSGIPASTANTRILKIGSSEVVTRACIRLLI